MAGRTDQYLSIWSARAMTSGVLAADVAMNAGFVHRNYPDVAPLGWIYKSTSAAAEAAREAGPPTALIIRLLGEDQPPGLTSPLPKIESPVDAALYSSLWCDDAATLAAVVSASPSFTLAGLMQNGGYDATHALGAAQLAAENGCTPTVATGGQPPTDRDAWAVLKPLILQREVDDLMLEACGIAIYRGLPDAISSARARFADIERAQRADGSFGRSPGREGDPHTTVWALRCLAPIASSLSVPRPTWIGP